MIKTKTILSLSRVLSHLVLTNLAFGLTNIVIFNHFWVDGWAYPSLFIIVNLSVILAFFFYNFKLINPSFKITNIFFLCLKNNILSSLVVTSYWLIIDSNNYYTIHLVLFLFLNFIFIFIGNLILNFILKKIYTSIFYERNVAIIYQDKYPVHFKNILTKNNWLNYKLVAEINITKIENFSLYIESLNIKEVFIFSNSKINTDKIKSKHLKYNLKYRVFKETKKMDKSIKLVLDSFYFE
jgi:hypothetical protein